MKSTFYGFIKMQITPIFYKDMNFLAKAFAEHKLCLFFKAKSFMCLKIWPKPLCAYYVVKFKNNWKWSK